MDPGISLFHLISTIGAFLSVSLGCFLFFIKSKINGANQLLGVLLWVYSLWFLPGFFEAIGLLEKFPHILRLHFITSPLLGSLTFLYCKASVHKHSLSFKSDFVHFFPFVLNILYNIPLLLMSKSEKLAMYHQTITLGKVHDPTVAIIAVCLAIIYAFLSIRLVFRYLQHLKNTSSSIDNSFHYWLLFLSSTLLSPVLVVLIYTFMSSSSLPVPIGLLIVASFVICIYVSLTLRPKFFHHFPYQLESEKGESKKGVKYQNSNLQDYQKNIYQSKISEHMETEKPYLHPELTITELSEQIKMPASHLSQIINERLDCNFLDFVNGYRIKEVKAKLKDPSLKHYTIMSIAYESGFNSKTAFYSTFKKSVGSTPSMFRKLG